MNPGGVLFPTDDMDASASFFANVMGLKQKFRDGDRYCAFEWAGTTLAIVGGEERIVSGPAFVFKVDDLAAGIAALTAQGAKVTRPAERGPHEERTVLAMPGGGQIVLSAKIK